MSAGATENVKVIFRLAAATGVHPYSYELRIGWRHVVITLVCVTLSVYSSLCFGPNTSLSRNRFYERFQGTIPLLAAPLVILTATAKRYALVNVYEFVEELDLQVQQNVEKDRLPLYFTIICNFISFVGGIFIPDTWNIFENGTFTYYWGIHAVHLIHYEFVTIAQILKNRFIKLRLALYKYDPGSILSFHARLLNACNTLNETFGVSILFGVTFLFILGSFQTYFAFAHGLHKIATTYRQDVLTAFFAVNALSHAYHLWTLTSICFQLRKEAQAFNETLYSMTLEDRVGRLSNDPKVKLHIAASEQFEFTACDFFKIDYTLFHTVVGATCTYVVILFQFKGQSTEEVINNDE